MDLPLRDPQPERRAEPDAPRPPSPGWSLPAGLLVVGLLTGFVGGWLAAQRMALSSPSRVVEAPRPVAGGTGAPASAPAPAAIVEAPVIEPPDVPVALMPLQAAPTVDALPPARQEASPPAVAGAAMLELASRPSGATVYVDNVRVGTTPVTIDDVEPGTRRVRMELPGHRPWTTSVEVDRGGHLRIGASLE